MLIFAHSVRALIIALLALTLYSVWQYTPSNQSLQQILTDPWIQHITLFSLKQSLQSTLLSLIFALPLLWSAHRGKLQILRHLLPITSIIPTLIFILSLLQLTQLLNHHLHTQWNLIGYHGILIAHTALNAPLIALLTLPALDALPKHYHHQRQILRLSPPKWYYHIVLPLIRPALIHALSLVFLLCFTSFTVLLLLGGSPRNANLELAIYQAIKYEFNLPQAAQLASLQTLLLLFFLALLPSRPITQPHATPTQPKHNRLANLLEPLFILLLCLPLAILLYNTLQHFNPHPPKLLWQALGNSLLLCALITTLAIALHILLAKTATLTPTSTRLTHHLIHAIYLTPVLILCLGLYLFLRPQINAFHHPIALNILLFTLLIQPYLYKFTYPSWQQHHIRSHRLARTLHLTPLQQLFKIDLPALAPLLGKASGFAAIIVLGDVAVISFFGSHNFQTLASYLIAELGHYRQNQAWQTTGILLITGLILFLFPQQLARLYQKHSSQ